MASDFRGGIQKGTTATSKLSKELDDHTKKAAKVLAKKYSMFTAQSKLRKDQIPGGIGSAAPDGLAWFYKNKLVLTFEAKYQKNGGNAGQRWFKNVYVCRRINPVLSVVTFAAGPGASRTPRMTKRGTLSYPALYHDLHVAHCEGEGGFDEFFLHKNSAFFDENGFTYEEIYAIMEHAIIEVLKSEGYYDDANQAPVHVGWRKEEDDKALSSAPSSILEFFR